jgi:hypothetical protein
MRIAESWHLGNTKNLAFSILLQQFQQVRSQKSRTAGNQYSIHDFPAPVPVMAKTGRIFFRLISY